MFFQFSVLIEIEHFTMSHKHSSCVFPYIIFLLFPENLIILVENGAPMILSIWVAVLVS